MPELYDIELEEVSLVDAGDNPEAKVVFFKRAKGEQDAAQEAGQDGQEPTDEWVRKAVEDVLAEEDHTTTSTTERRERLGDKTIVTRETTTLQTKREVLEVLEDLGEQIAEAEDVSARVGKTLAMERYPKLYEAYLALPEAEPVAPADPVYKGSGPYAQLEEVAKGLMAKDATLTRPLAMIQAADKRPDLAAAYHKEFGAY